MRKLMEIAFVVLTLCAVVAAISLVVILSQDAWNALQASDPNVVAAILFSCAIAIALAAVFVAVRSSERNALLVREVRDRRAPVYEELVKLLYGFHIAPLAGERVNRKDLMKKLHAVQQKMLLVGSERALMSLSEMWESLVAPEDDEDWPDLREALGNLLLVLRSDMGQSCYNLDEEEAIGLFGTDFINYYLPPDPEKS